MKQLKITFVKNNWFIAALQSILFFEKITDIWTHVQIGFVNKKEDFSAEMVGIIYILREKLKGYRKYQSFIIPITDQNILNDIELEMNRLLNSKYDFYFYVRWFFNVLIMILPFMAILFNFSMYYFFTILIIYIPINYTLQRLSINSYGCSEIVCKILKEKGKIDFGYKKFHNASPHYMIRSIFFSKQFGDTWLDFDDFKEERRLISDV